MVLGAGGVCRASWVPHKMGANSFQHPANRCPECGHTERPGESIGVRGPRLCWPPRNSVQGQSMGFGGRGEAPQRPAPREGLGDDRVLLRRGQMTPRRGEEDTGTLGAWSVADTDPGSNPSLTSVPSGGVCGFFLPGSLQARRDWCGGGEWAA